MSTRGINVQVIGGNLTKDVKVINEEKGTSAFSIAVNEKFGEKENTEYFNCVAYNKLGEVISQYFNKGDYITVSARKNTYEKDGEKYTNYIVETFAFPGSGVNVCVLSGRVTREGELTHFNSQYNETPVASLKFNMAVGKKIGENEYVQFPQIRVRGKIAESISEYIKKGTALTVIGEFRKDVVENDDGSNSYFDYFQASKVSFVPVKKKEENSSNNTSSKSDEDVNMEEDLELDIDEEKLFADDDIF